MIDLERLSLTYDGRSVVVNEINLRIEAEAITALVGPNGCGKSTLLRGISRLLKPMAGGAYLDGEAIHTMPSKELARRLGILPQGPSAPEGLTVHELAAQGRYPHQSWLRQWSREDERVVLDALETTNLTAFADRTVDTLSGGQRQRAWIAMALAQDTGILLLDEPTTFLDLPHQLDILALVHTLSRQKGQTVAMVLHDINLAARFCDRIVAMRDRGIIRQGTPNEVVTEGNIAAIYGMRSVVITDPTHGTPHVIPK